MASEEIIGSILTKTPDGWRRKSFFYDRRRQLSFLFDDAAHEDPNPAERVPDPTEIHTALREYLLEVVETGDDPLDELRVAVPWIGETWQFRFRDWCECDRKGPLFIAGRKDSRGAWLEGDRVPAPVLRYLGIFKVADDAGNSVWVCGGFDSLGTLIQTGIESGFITWQKTFKGEHARGEAKGVSSVKIRESPDKVRRIVQNTAVERLAEMNDPPPPSADTGKDSAK